MNVNYLFYKCAKFFSLAEAEDENVKNEIDQKYESLRQSNDAIFKVLNSHRFYWQDHDADKDSLNREAVIKAYEIIKSDNADAIISKNIDYSRYLADLAGADLLLVSVLHLPNDSEGNEIKFGTNLSNLAKQIEDERAEKKDAEIRALTKEYEEKNKESNTNYVKKESTVDSKEFNLNIEDIKTFINTYQKFFDPSKISTFTAECNRIRGITSPQKTLRVLQSIKDLFNSCKNPKLNGELLNKWKRFKRSFPLDGMERISNTYVGPIYFATSNEYWQLR